MEFRSHGPRVWRSDAAVAEKFHHAAAAIAGLFLCLFLFSSCSSDWEKKFIRKREKPAAPARFDVDNAPVRPYADLYREHFNFWKSWHRELIGDLQRNLNHKRELQDLNECRRHLDALSKYLNDEKAKQAKDFVKRFDQITAEFRAAAFAPADDGILVRELEGFQREVESRLHPKKIKEVLKKTPVKLNLSDYQGDEPPLFVAGPVKAESAAADSLKDGNGTLTYEKYRSLTAR